MICLSGVIGSTGDTILMVFYYGVAVVFDVNHSVIGSLI